MKIAFVTTDHPSNIHAWSGIVSYLYETLQEAGFDLQVIGNLDQPNLIRSMIKKAFYSGLLGKKYLRDREPALLKHFARQVEQQLADIDCDVLLGPGYAPLVYLNSDKPFVFWADATFAGLLDFYPAYSHLCSESIRNGHKMEQMALSKCRFAIYSSEWAANSAIEHYDVDPAKVKVLPFGANISCQRTREDIAAIASRKSFDVCRLLFVGVDWQRKGGDIALAVATRLNKRGVKTELHVVGCEPDSDTPAFVIRHGFISKHTQSGRQQLDTLFSESHFLILPTRAECFGIVFSEASSFGLPSLATDVGGIPTAIHNGKNGFTFALDADPETYCDVIEQWMSSKADYTALALSSFAEYSERLNWKTIGKKLRTLLIESE